MRTLLPLAVFYASPFLALCQSPSAAIAGSPAIAGVWKADLSKSKIAGPPLENYLAIIEQKTVVVNRRTGEQAPELDETTGTWSQRGEQRSVLSFLTNGMPAVRPFQGIPTRFTASWQDNTLKLAGEVAGRPVTINRTYELSADAQTLTIDSLTTGNGHRQQSTIVLLKQPDAAGEPLRKPEETAEQHFKNVKTDMKALPASQFIDQMRYFAWSLGKDCEFCHVKDHFDSDDKKEKKAARDMVVMVGSIDRDNFKGRPEVRCFTCHEGHNHPLSRPLFPDEIAKMESAQERGPEHPAQGAGSGPKEKQP